MPELVSKSLPERANGGQTVEIRVYVFWGVLIRGMIPGWIKLPFIPTFPPSATPAPSDQRFAIQ